MSQSAPPRRFNLWLFLFMWLMVGFSTGTSTLVGPVRWVTGLIRKHDSPPLETASVRLIIVLFVLGSAVVARWSMRLALETPHRHVRFGIPTLVALAAGGALGLWMTPGSIDAHLAEQSKPGSLFTFGPYPTEERLLTLKLEGYTAVLSLLHPAVIPFEPKLLADEQAAAARVGIDLIHLPMLPWVAENKEALDKARELAARRSGRYYVHCYLGMDRVLLVKRVVEQAERTVQTVAEKDPRSLEGKHSLERGEVHELDEDLYLTPYPTDDEFSRYVIGSTVAAVVSLLDADNPEHARWIEKERELLARYGLRFELASLSARRFDPHRVLEAARTVRTLPRPLVVHAFLSPGSGSAPTAEAFLQAFRADLPPLPPSLFREPMQRGRVEVLAPNLAVGPEPRDHEFADYLRPRGVREIVYVGGGQAAALHEDRTIAQRAGMRWRSVDAGAEFLGELGRGGPWYLYGPGASALKARVAERLGPAIPDKLRVPSVREQARSQEASASPPAPRPPDGNEPQAGGLMGFLARAVPETRVVILLGPPLLLFAALSAHFVGWLRVTKGLRAPYTRKIFHFIIFTSAGVLHLLGGLSTVTLFGGLVTLAVLYAVARGDGFAFYEAMARPTDHPHRTLFVLVPLTTTALGGVLANVFFSPFAHIGYLVGGWGDAVGEPVGARWGRRPYAVPSLAGVKATRSVEGSAAVTTVGILAAFLGLVASGQPLLAALLVGAACGLAGAAVEAVSNHGLDNLTVQLVAAGVAQWLLG